MRLTRLSLTLRVLSRAKCIAKAETPVTLATSCQELTHWKRLWCWEGLGEGGEGDDRGWEGWMASLTRWMWVWVDSGSWWWTGRPDVLRFMGLQRVGHDWATDLIWCDVNSYYQDWPGTMDSVSDSPTQFLYRSPERRCSGYLSLYSCVFSLQCSWRSTLEIVERRVDW